MFGPIRDSRTGAVKRPADESRMPSPEGRPPIKSLIGTQMRYQGERVGKLYVAEEGGWRRVQPRDEETLALFALQAALVKGPLMRAWRRL